MPFPAVEPSFPPGGESKSRREKNLKNPGPVGRLFRPASWTWESRCNRCNSYIPIVKRSTTACPRGNSHGDRPTRSRPVRGDRQDPAHRRPFAHRPAPADGPVARRPSRLSLLHRACPFRRHGQGPALRRLAARTDALPARPPGPHRQHGAIRLVPGDLPHVPRLPGRPARRRRRRRALGRRRARLRPARLGRAGAAPFQPGKSVPHQRL